MNADSALETPRDRRVIRTPAVSLSTLARATGPISPAALARLLRGHKYPTGGAARSYQLARTQAVDLLVDGTPLNPDAELRPYERDVVRAMARTTPKLPEWTRGVRPSTRSLPWMLEGVRISMHPDVEIQGYTANGAAKLSFTKERLMPTVGSTMASLLWHYRSRVLHLPRVEPDHCIVFEPRLPWIHRPQRNKDKARKNAELACRVIAALWPLV